MKFASSIVLSLLAIGAEAKTSPAKGTKLNRDFMAAMSGNDKLRAPKRKAKSDERRKRELYEKVTKSAKPLTDEQKEKVRELQNNNYDNYNNYNADGAYWAAQAEDVFDMTSRSFKFSGCAAIKSFDADKAMENGNPMVIDTYAVFRLCPAESCNKYSMTGCGKNYGEYAIELKTYLQYMLEYYTDRYEEYCEYCLPCDEEVKLESNIKLNCCYEAADDVAFQYNQQAQQQAWDEYYQANGGDMSNFNNGGYNPYNNGNGLNGNYYNGGGNRKLDQYNQNQNYNAYGNQNQNNQNGYGYYANNNNNGQNQNQNQNQNNYQNNNYQNNNYNYNQNDQNQNNQNQYNQCVNSGYAQYYNNFYQGMQNQGENQGENQYQYQNQNQNQNQNQDYESKCMGERRKLEDQACMDADCCIEQVATECGVCDDYICGDYLTYCTDFYGEAEENFDIYNYLECTEYVNEQGQQYWIGPHCGGDHWTISLGVFSDENCGNYIGETISLATVLGYGYDDDDLFQIPKECISCDGTEAYAEEAEAEENEYEGRYTDYNGEYVKAPETTEDGVVAMCQALYEQSAQCNKHMNNYNQMSMFMTQQEIDQETRYCSFIDNIAYGAYDEQGEILLTSESFSLADWQNVQQYKKIRMPAGQAIGLALSGLLVVVLIATAFVTHRSLKKQATPWQPKDLDPNNLSRQNSGIVMGRSRSGPGAAPLI